MKSTKLITGFITIGALCVIGCNREVKPKVFEPDNISTQFVEYSSSFSASGSEVYFAKSQGKWGKGGMKSAVYVSTKENGTWSAPKLAPFSGEYNDSGPHLSRDGNVLFFISDRPGAEGKEPSSDIWKVERDSNNNWGTPKWLGNSINSDKSEYSPRTDKFGNLYFASNRSGGYGQGDLYIAKKEKDTFGLPVNLGNTINSGNGEWNLGINDEGDMLIFESSGREENLSPYGDLYISFKSNNQWSLPQNIKELNTTGSDLYPELTHGDKLLYYTSSDSLKSTDTNIYSIEFEGIHKKYREAAVFPE